MFDKIRHNIVSRIASRHVAGKDLSKALVVCQWAVSKGNNYILSPWADGNNRDLNEASKEKNANSFIQALRAMQKIEGDGYLSLKLDAIDYDYELFIRILDVAKNGGIRIHIDSLAPDTCDLNFAFLERALEFQDYLGCTLPSRWRRSIDDAERAIDMNLPVRMVKGQWEDPENKVDSRSNYIAIVNKIAGNVPYIGVATHDKKLADASLKILKSAQHHFELEQFFSLPLNGIGLTKKYYCPYRIYVSYGHPAIPYNYRFAMTRPILGVWMASDFAFRFKKPWENSH